MLAAAVRQREKENEDPTIRLPRTIITADDVLDIKSEIRAMRMNTIRALDRSSASRKRSVEASNPISPPENSANNV